jgi:uncharacterized protein
MSGGATDGAGLEVSFAPGMASVDRGEWDGLLGPRDRPLLSWGFLALLEESGSIRPETGWSPAHALVRRGGELLAAAPFYVKSHSWGEFVFDFQFAELAERLGAPWYPKLVGMVPATPAPAWRVLVKPGSSPSLAEELERTILLAAADAAREGGLGGLHVLWPEPGTASRLRELETGRGRASRRFAEWEHQAFLWTDSGFGDFAGYLASFSKNMRRNVKRERESVAAAGVVARIIRPEEAAARPRLLEAMAELYESHNDKFGPWAAKFLERDFFIRLPEFMPEGWCLSAAFEGSGEAGSKEGEPLALAFLLEGGDRLYGRFYGTRREVPGLHFELCYYLPIEYALAEGIGSFDPGMGSPHKARRGFASISAPSFHLAFDRRLAEILARALPPANAEEREGIEALNEELPFKKGG